VVVVVMVRLARSNRSSVSRRGAFVAWEGDDYNKNKKQERAKAVISSPISATSVLLLAIRDA
jgi:hypothetical protein